MIEKPRTEPLAGVRVLDFGRVVGGAGSTGILAKYGAEVIKVEWPENPGLDFIRFSRGADGVEGINRGGVFNMLNVDKLSITLNMKTTEGIGLAKRLLSICDVVLENFTPRVMKSWGLDYESVRKIRPDIVYVSQSGWGQNGPRAMFRSFGFMAFAHSGLAYLAGLPGRPPAGWQTSYADHYAAWVGASATIMALHYRQKTGKGVFIDLAQTQGMTALAGVQFLDYSVNGRGSRRPGFPDGNKRQNPPVAPHNVFPCLVNDTWVAVSVFTNEEWEGLKAAMGHPRWAEDPKFGTSEGRFQHQEELDGLLAKWTRGFERYELAGLLQHHGVPAGVVQTARDRVEWDPQLEHRGTFKLIHHPEVGHRRYETVAARLSKQPYKPKRPAPQLGQHNDYVLKELLGLAEPEIADLVAKDAIRITTNRGGHD